MFRMSFPKVKKGEAIVQEIKEAASFGKSYLCIICVEFFVETFDMHAI